MSTEYPTPHKHQETTYVCNLDDRQVINPPPLPPPHTHKQWQLCGNIASSGHHSRPSYMPPCMTGHEEQDREQQLAGCSNSIFPRSHSYQSHSLEITFGVWSHCSCHKHLTLPLPPFGLTTYSHAQSCTVMHCQHCCFIASHAPCTRGPEPARNLVIAAAFLVDS